MIHLGQFVKGLLKNKYLVLLDQTLLSIINFGSILVLSKMASIAVFGAFVVTFSYSYFIYLFATLGLSAPMLIFLKKKWEKQEGGYLLINLILNFVINLIFSTGCYYFLSQQIEDVPFFLFFMLAFSMSFFDILKKFIFSSDSIAIKHAVVSTLLLNIIFYFLLYIYRNTLVLSTILNIYLISFMVTSLYILVVLLKKKIMNFKMLSFPETLLQFINNILRTHFNYSKWIILGGIAFWAYSQGIYILAKNYDVSDFIIGKVRTIQNLLGVFAILLITLENHYTPIFASKAIKGTLTDLNTMIRVVFKENYIKVISLYVLAIPIGLLFYEIVYSDKYGEGWIIFMLFLGVQFMLVVLRPFAIALKAIEITIPFFISHIFAVISLFISFPLLLRNDMNYALPLAIFIANVIYVSYIGFYYFNKLKAIKKQTPIE